MNTVFPMYISFYSQYNFPSILLHIGEYIVFRTCVRTRTRMRVTIRARTRKRKYNTFTYVHIHKINFTCINSSWAVWGTSYRSSSNFLLSLRIWEFFLQKYIIPVRLWATFDLLTFEFLIDSIFQYSERCSTVFLFLCTFLPSYQSLFGFPVLRC